MGSMSAIRTTEAVSRTLCVSTPMAPSTAAPASAALWATRTSDAPTGPASVMTSMSAMRTRTVSSLSARLTTFANVRSDGRAMVSSVDPTETWTGGRTLTSRVRRRDVGWTTVSTPPTRVRRTAMVTASETRVTMMLTMTVSQTPLTIVPWWPTRTRWTQTPPERISAETPVILTRTMTASSTRGTTALLFLTWTRRTRMETALEMFATIVQITGTKTSLTGMRTLLETLATQMMTRTVTVFLTLWTTVPMTPMLTSTMLTRMAAETSAILMRMMTASPMRGTTAGCSSIPNSLTKTVMDVGTFAKTIRMAMTLWTLWTIAPTTARSTRQTSGPIRLLCWTLTETLRLTPTG